MDVEGILEEMEDKVLFIGEAFGYEMAEGRKVDIADLAIHLADIYRGIKKLKSDINESE